MQHLHPNLAPLLGSLLFLTISIVAENAYGQQPGSDRQVVESGQAVDGRHTEDGRTARERQKAVESGLIPAVVIEGSEVQKSSIYDRMQHYGVPGVGIAVIRDGRVDWADGYGLKRAGGADSVGASTLFQAASISKSVAAAGALRLVDEGRLQLDDDVNEHLESWTVPEDSYTDIEPVTLRRLLQHTAGFTVHGFPGYASGEDIPTAVEVIRGIGNTDPVVIDTLPGSIWRYSGGGYTVAQVLVEDVAAVPFAEYMRRFILTPLGMDKSTFVQPLPGSLSEGAATAHGWDGTPIDGSWHAYPEMAAAGLWTTPTDLARFALAVRDAYLGEPGAFLSSAASGEMLTPHESGYGLGVGVIGEGDALRFSHSGANAGYRCIFVMYPTTGNGVVVMTNADGGADLTSEVMRSASDVYGWPDYKPKVRAVVSVDPGMLRKFEGTYEMNSGAVVTIRSGDDVLLADADRRFPERLLPESENTFFGTAIDMRIRFDEDADGEVVGFSILRGESEISAAKIR